MDREPFLDRCAKAHAGKRPSTGWLAPNVARVAFNRMEPPFIIDVADTRPGTSDQSFASKLVQSGDIERKGELEQFRVGAFRLAISRSGGQIRLYVDGRSAQQEYYR